MLPYASRQYPIKYLCNTGFPQYPEQVRECGTGHACIVTWIEFSTCEMSRREEIGISGIEQGEKGNHSIAEKELEKNDDLQLCLNIHG